MTVVDEPADPTMTGYTFDKWVDENGNEVDGDAMIYILGKRMKMRGTLNDNTVVTTIMSNSGFVASLEKIGIKTAQTKVGDRFVWECMQKKTAAGRQTPWVRR